MDNDTIPKVDTKALEDARKKKSWILERKHC